VQVATSRAQSIELSRQIRGFTQPWASATLAAETEGRVIEVLHEPGDEVQAGDVLVRIDPRARQAVLAQAQAAVKQAQAEYTAAQRLAKQGHLSANQLAEREASLRASQAQLQQAQLDLDASTVRSPIDGRLEARMVDVGDYLKTGNPLAEVAQLDPLRLVAFVSERDVGALQRGQSVRLYGSEGEDQDLRGEVHFVAHTADPQSRTYRVDVRLDNPGQLPAGASLRGVIGTGKAMAHALPISLLDLDSSGTLGIFTVEAESSEVRRYAVSLVRTDSETAWLTGMPATVDVIRRGQGFVSAGDQVRVSRTEG
jgi:multidrug efflux system membrane fusion protein